MVLIGVIVVSGGCSSSQKTESPNSTPSQRQNAQQQADSPSALANTPASQSSGVPANAQATVPSQSPPVQLSSVSPESQKKAVELFEKGYHVFDVERGPNRLNDAIKLYDQALAIDPDCYQAYTGKGIAVAFKGDLREALKQIDKAIAIKPDYAFAYYNKGLALKYHGKFDEALVWFDKALVYDPNHAWTYFGKSAIYNAQKKTRECLDSLAKSIEILPYCKVTAKEKMEADFGNVKHLQEFKRLVAE